MLGDAMSGQENNNAGFTLIELLIAIAIVGVLAATAYPSYQDHVRRGHRAAAQSLMLEIAQRQQQHFLNSRSYAKTLTALNYPADVLAEFPSGSSVATDVAPFYTVASPQLGALDGPPPSFQLSLQPLTGTLQVGDGALCISNAGSRTRNCQSGGSVAAW